MNAFTVIALVASLAFTSGQLTTNLAGGSGASGAAGGPLDAMAGMSNNPMGGAQNNPINGMMGMNGMNGMNPMGGSGMNSMLMPMAVMGGNDAMMRAAMMPAMSRFGTVPSYYFMRSGMDKMMKSYGANMMASALQQSGMNPMMATLFSGKMMDAPDGYTMMNMLLNSQGMSGNSGMGGMGGMGGAMNSPQVPQGAAAGQASQNNNNNNPFGSLFSNPIGMMAMTGMF